MMHPNIFKIISPYPSIRRIKHIGLIILEIWALKKQK